MKPQVVFSLLFLLALSSATITINVPPSPANLSTVVGTSATFNWTASGTACTASQLWVFKSIGGIFSSFGMVPVASCSGSAILTNLTDGNYGWIVGTNATPPENSSTWNFTDAPSINLTILYPPNNSAYGPGQCWLLTTIQLNDSGGPGATRSVSLSLYENNGTTWLLNQTKSCAGNCTVNWTGITDNAPYAVNATALVDGTGANSSTVNFNLVGTSFCAGGPNDDSPKWNFIAFLIIGATLLMAGFEVLE